MHGNAFVGSAAATGRAKFCNSSSCRRRPRITACTSGERARSSTFVLLGAVPFLWGTFGTSVKLLGDMPPAVLNAGACISAALIAAVVSHRHQSTVHERIAAAELALYLFMGSVLNLQALSLLSASRAAFWMQLTSVFVPAAAALIGEPIPAVLPPAAAIAALGAAVISRDSATAPLSLGDLAGVAAAMCYSAHVLRLEILSRARAVAPPAALVRDTYLAQCAMALAVVAASATKPGAVRDYLTVIPSLASAELAAASAGVLWIGVATSALATWAQIAGQKRVGPSRAAVVYSAQPVCSMLIAFLSGVEIPTMNEVLGGILISAAAVVAASAGGEREPESLTTNSEKL